ncbi:MAG: HPr family phosphocarrier protein [Phycisphaeraceae bacterium]|nr:HPr family phosphocarrier protein [Phycisphaeraceae bacterium]
MSEPLKVIVTIRNKLGLHARPAMSFVDAANRFQSVITVCRAGAPGPGVDGKSIMQMMMLAATKGTDLEVCANGPDAAAAIEVLKELVESGFDEE